MIQVVLQDSVTHTIQKLEKLTKYDIEIHKNVHNKHNTQSNILYTNAFALLILCIRY